MKNIISITLSIIIIFSMAATGSIADAQSLSNAKSQNVSSRYYFKPIHFVHHYKLIQIKQSTCTNRGYSIYRCSICGKERFIYKELAKHTIVIDKAIKATCANDGLTEGSHCDKCGKIIVKQEVIDALTDCTYEETIVPATPQKDGAEKYYCKRCDIEQTNKISRPKAIKMYIDKGYTTDFYYTGKAIKPQIDVLDAKGNKIHAYYSVTFENNVNIGIASVTVDFGNSSYDKYNGTLTAHFNIIEKKGTSLTSLKRPAIIKIQAVKPLLIYYTYIENAEQYEFQYSKQKSFKDYKKLYTTPLNNKTFGTLSTNTKADSGKEIYVRLMAINKEKGIMSPWSEVKSVKLNS